MDASRSIVRCARLGSIVTLAAVVAACGGGGGDTAVSGSICSPGLLSGFGGSVGDPSLNYIIMTGGQPGEGGGGGAGDGGGGVGGGGGEGVGGSDGQFTSVHVSLETAAGMIVRPWMLDAETGMVTYVPCQQRPPARVTFAGLESAATYYDEGTRRDESFSGRQRFGLLTEAGRNSGVTPLSEALYRRTQALGEAAGRSDGWRDLALIAQAHQEVKASFNDHLPGMYRIEDLTRLPVMLNARNDIDGASTLTPNANGIYGAVLAGLSLTAHTNLPGFEGSGAELGDALVKDLADGRLDLAAGDGSPIARVGRTPYSFESLWAHLTVGAGVTAARLGVDGLKNDVIPIGYVQAPAPAGAATGGETVYVLTSGGQLVTTINGAAAVKPAATRRFSQLYRFGPDSVVALRRDGLGLLVFPSPWDGHLAVEVAAPEGKRIVEMFDAGRPMMRMADGGWYRLDGTALAVEPAPAGVLNAVCRAEYDGAVAAGSDAVLGERSGTVCYGPDLEGRARAWRQGRQVAGLPLASERIVQVSGNEQIILGLQADGAVLQLDADHAVSYVNESGGPVTAPTPADRRQLLAAASPPKRIDLPRVCWLRAPFAIGCDGSAWAMVYQEYRSAGGEFMGAGPITGVRPLPIPTPVWRTRANRRLTLADAEMTADAVFIGVNGKVYDLNGTELHLPTDGPAQDPPNQPPPSPEINQLAGDDILTRAEAETDLVVTGSAQAGSTVTVTLGAFSGQTTANGQGQWQLAIPAAALPRTDGDVQVRVTATNPNGTSESASRTLRVARAEAQPPQIAAVTGDNRVTPAEASAGVAITGTAQAGVDVTVTWGGRSKSTQAGGGAWTVRFEPGEVPAPGQTQVTAVASNANGTSAPAQVGVEVVAAAPAAPVIAPVAGNDSISPAEADGNVPISGTAAAGSQVTVTWAGRSKSTTADAAGNWTVVFSANELPPQGSTTTVTAVASNSGGNSEPASRPVVREAPPVVATPAPEILAINGGQEIEADLLRQRGFQITGTRAPGSEVRVTIGSTSRVVAAGAGVSWGVNFLGSETVRLLLDARATEVVVTAVAVIAQQPESAVVTRSFKLSWTRPEPPIVHDITGDSYIQADERAKGFMLTGNALPGTMIRLTWVATQMGRTRTEEAGSTLANIDGRWAVEIEAGATNWMDELIQVELRAVASNPAGDSRVASRQAKVEPVTRDEQELFTSPRGGF